MSGPADPTQVKALAQQQEHFAAEGYVVLPNVLSPAQCGLLSEQIKQDIDPLVGPAEFEADVGYPGAPSNRAAPGGTTPRRLLHAYARSEELKALATEPQVTQTLATLLHGPVLLSQCHHNCVMTKHPGYSSATLWHQDVRYWSFAKPELVSAWFALGPEIRENGALQVIPRTHLLDVEASRLDEKLFLRPELAENQALIQRAKVVELSPGDVLLFHCRLFHAAGRNSSEAVKLSAVFTYHGGDNRAEAGTRSDRLPSIGVTGGETNQK
ncbi:MAG: phytanoyl-CoA dioxygenase family protein [Proteobacteria bacterium]|nr:phytanoyl-CoA dioxygenase family protein [Pseudomonadota bacterium]